MPSSHTTLADDHSFVRESLKILLEGDGYIVVGEASEVPSQSTSEGRLSHTVIMGIAMPVMNRVDAARMIPNTDSR